MVQGGIQGIHSNITPNFGNMFRACGHPNAGVQTQTCLVDIVFMLQTETLERLFPMFLCGFLLQSKTPRGTTSPQFQVDRERVLYKSFGQSGLVKFPAARCCDSRHGWGDRRIDAEEPESSSRDLIFSARRSRLVHIESIEY